MRWPADTSLHPLLFWPDHRGEKSPEPWLSALARKGAIAEAAKGNAGVALLMEPKLSHDAVHDSPCGAAREKVRQRRVAGGLTLERSAVHCAGRGFHAQQISRSNLYAGCTECHRRRNAFRIGNAASSNDRDPDLLAQFAAPMPRCQLESSGRPTRTYRDVRPPQGPAQ